MEIAKADDWAGYFGSPRAASSAFGERYWEQFSTRTIDLALKILDGYDYRQGRRVEQNPASRAALAHQMDLKKKQSEWLEGKGYE